MKKKPRNYKTVLTSSRYSLIASVFIFSVVAAGAYSFVVPDTNRSLNTTQAAGTWPTTPPAQICGNASILDGPSTPPAGAVVVPAGDNSGVNLNLANTTYYFETGVHTLGSGQYSQIIPGNNGRYVGAPGAILDGQKLNQYAFTQHGENVTIEYLTIQNFGAVGSNNNEGVVNHDGGNGWTIQYNTVQNNAGAGVFVGDDNTIRYNCLTNNEQYGWSAYEPDGVVNVVLDHNEISYNNTHDWETLIPGCGCTGGGKFWNTFGAVVTNNYVHNNYSVGIWADGNNSDFLIDNNYVADNDNVGIFYEQSYNAIISNNNLTGNALVKGPTNPGFPAGAIYISEAGGDSRAPGGDTVSTIDIVGNNFENNWSGVILWENADRYCGSPANTSAGLCTLVNPTVVTTETCNATNITLDPYYDDCRWKTQNVKVYDNNFVHDSATIGNGCDLSTGCGYNGIFSNWGTYPDWSPYTARTVQDAITYSQGNEFYNNTYDGGWRFLPWETGNVKTLAEWQASPYNQDTGSTINNEGDTSGGGGGGSGGGGTVVNPGEDGGTKTFETDTENLNNWYSTTIAQSSADFYAGSYSLAITTTGGNWGVEESWPGAIGVIAGEEYEISGWVKADTIGRAITLTAVWRDSSQAQVGTNVSFNGTTNTSGWTELTTTSTAPDGAVSIQFLITGDSGAAGEVQYIDEISVTNTTPTNTFADSDINQDGKVDIIDLSILLSAWGQAGTADLDNSGEIDIVDLSILLSNWDN